MITNSLLITLAIAFIGTLLLILRAIFNYYYYNLREKLSGCCLYVGRVQHSRLKGATNNKSGVVHKLEYPLFFSFIDLQEIENVNYLLWPIFTYNSKLWSFCSLDSSYHLKDFPDRDNSGNSGSTFSPLLARVKNFVSKKSGNRFTTDCRVQLMSHLTYFGYCFNPISIYYLFDSKSKNSDTDTKEGIEGDNCMAAVIAEVSNTPWNEQHTYLLHESVEGVVIDRSGSSDLTKEDNKVPTLSATWKKEFHVSPFMEMDYTYHFSFGKPAESVVVRSKMIKNNTKEVWFTASFVLNRIPFTPLNLIYVLIFYPLHTRIIQIWIHIEAIKIFFKGVPTFEHPNGTDVDFGYGITGKRLGDMLWFLIQPFYKLYSVMNSIFCSISGFKSISKDKMKVQ